MPKVFAGNYADIFDIKGKKAVVVGGAGGFGKEIAKAFAQRGAGRADLLPPGRML